MNEFDKKRDVVKSLMSMLHSNANDEISKHMQPMHAEGCMDKMCAGGCAKMAEGGMVDDSQAQQGNMLQTPNRQDGTYQDDSSSQTYKSPAAQQREGIGMAKGGMAMNSDIDSLSAPNSLHPEPESAELSGSESAELHPAPDSGEHDMAKIHSTSNEDEDEENNQSAFMGLMKKKKA